MRAKKSTSKRKIFKAISTLGKIRILPKEKRTQKNPVIVVFVCFYGGSSTFCKTSFERFLQKKKISSIVSSSFFITGKRTSNLLPASKIKEAFANADFVVPTRIFLRDARKEMTLLRNSLPRKAKLLKPFTPIRNDYGALVEAIRKRFKLQE